MANDSCAVLADQRCVPCRGGVPPLAGEELLSFHERLGSEWQLIDNHHLEKAALKIPLLRLLRLLLL